jgi:hypothetical protein
VDVSIQIPDITQEQVIEAMAARLLGEQYQRDDEFDPDDPTPRPASAWDRKAIGKHLRQHFEARIKETVQSMVKDALDDAIRQTIATQVRAIMEEGYQPVDDRGRPSGARRTLRDIVLDALTVRVRRNSYSSDTVTVAERVTADTLEEALKRDFGKEISDATTRFRQQVDALIQGKFTETIKAALGMR